ncbi:MAG: biotin/lipoyl-containing protein [Acidobacteriota bacterium]
MTFEIEVNARSRIVSIERTGPGQYRVTVDGQTRALDAARIGSHGLSLILGGGSNVSREVHVAPSTVRGELLVLLEGRTVTATVNARRTGRAAADAGSHGPGEQAVVAPMPGRVVRVLVSEGDEVAARQPVVVVEAMKMENELSSPKAGRVKDVAVTPGMSVEAGRVLIVIE